MTIICASDLSTSSRAGVAAARAIARSNDEELWLVHSLDLYDPQTRPMDLESAHARASDHLARLRTELAPTSPCAVRTVVLYGAPTEALPELAAERKPTLFIVSSEGHGAKPFHRLGGASERLARDLPGPLLVAREPIPFEAWAARKRPLRIVLGISRTRNFDGALAWVEHLRALGPCEVTVAYVYDAHDERGRAGMKKPHALTVRDPDLEARIEADMRALAPLSRPESVRYRPVLGIGRLGDHLVDLAHELAADLIVLGKVPYGPIRRLASVASVTLHYARASVLLVPPQSRPTHAANMVNDGG